jgi:hypothetical protein
MVDIETLGIKPGSVILVIAATAFDIHTGEITDEFITYVNVKSCTDEGMTIDANTLQWWECDNRELYKDLVEKIINEGIPIEEALKKFNIFVKQHKDGNDSFKIWAKSPSFDLILLKVAYNLFGMVIPWYYRDELDVRTLLQLTDGNFPDFEVEGKEHDGLYDCRIQAKRTAWAYGNVMKRK